MAGVLIVEDEIFVALDIEHILISAGFEIAGIAQDRRSAMALAAECDVALIDVNLHDGATGPSIGMDIVAKHGVNIIFVTSHPFLIGAAADIAIGVITKPFRPDMIVDMVRRALTGGRRDAITTIEEGAALFSPAPSPASNQFQS
jgi:DNA-binding NtrC family response regulator